MKFVSSAVCAAAALALPLLNASTSVEALHIMRRMEANKRAADGDLPKAAKLRADGAPGSPRTPTGPTATAAITQVDDEEDEEAMLAAAIALSQQPMDVSAPATPAAASAASTITTKLEPPAPVEEKKDEPTFKDWYDKYGDAFLKKYADNKLDLQHGTSKCPRKSFLNALEQLQSGKTEELEMGEAAANIKWSERFTRRCSHCGLSYSKEWNRSCEKTVEAGGLACGKSGMTKRAMEALGNGVAVGVADKMGGERI